MQTKEIRELLHQYVNQTSDKKVKALYCLLGIEDNNEHLHRSIAQLKKGESKAIKTKDLWK